MSGPELRFEWHEFQGLALAILPGKTAKEYIAALQVIVDKGYGDVPASLGAVAVDGRTVALQFTTMNGIAHLDPDITGQGKPASSDSTSGLDSATRGDAPSGSSPA
jgi:hypothetical protein